MSPTIYVELPAGDDLVVIGGEPSYLIRRTYGPDPRAAMRVSNYEGDPKPLDPPGTPTEPPPTEPPPGGGTPPPTGNLIPQGDFKDDAGKPSLEGWEQEPNKVWFEGHKPVPGSPTGLPLAQADTSDPHHVSPWPSTFPSEATLRTETVAGLPSHNQVKLGWEVAHHIRDGIALWELEGRVGESGAYTACGVFAIPDNTPGDKRPRTVQPKTIVVPAGGYSQYRLTARVRLGSDYDGIVFTAVTLTLA